MAIRKLKIIETETGNGINNKIFSIRYFDDLFFNEIKVSFQVVRTSEGRMWTFIVENEDFFQRKLQYIQSLKSIFQMILPTLIDKYNFSPQIVTIHHKSNILII
ncbi:hypothetical protein CEF21_16600 [Bacillus sp. FJAT-42376]|nr:hypothetical protein CEF21_16600 [Bacillus sp. FJAT-42376]